MKWYTESNATLSTLLTSLESKGVFTDVTFEHDGSVWNAIWSK